MTAKTKYQKLNQQEQVIILHCSETSNFPVIETDVRIAKDCRQSSKTLEGAVTVDLRQQSYQRDLVAEIGRLVMQIHWQEMQTKNFTKN